MIKNRNKIFWISIGIGSLIILFLILISNIMDVGERLRRINVSVEIAFYIVSALVVYFLIINPIRIIIFSPTFQIQTVLDKDTRKTRKIYKKVAKNIIKKNKIDETAIAELRQSIKDPAELRLNLMKLYNDNVKKELNKIIIRNAKTVMISTAISQNGKLDMFTVLAVNLKMIKELVLECGFRPSFTNLGKLSVNVLVTALIADGLEDLNFNDLFPASTTGFLSDIPLIKPIMSSIMQGISNALLTLRIGLVTRRFLFSDLKEVSKKEIRREALKESIKMLPVIVKESIVVFPERIRSFFRKKTTDEYDDAMNA
ncbi:MAG TPA: DUF697 domain-containing protein [Bacilli bacterium]|nr:DUF697 domain-containing protein [Bacilli bacterium]HOR96081.1 DUF697 domain-containing protein [Bacilli bacterium]HPD12673.1 DUF697 domain-containing protein [Bacilli bacterium]HPK59065.1 DUF697 domain-containing protein [Bacilli bacterium]HRS30906.1 DUF697 domain-containing protein [Bacilli bacterium]